MMAVSSEFGVVQLHVTSSNHCDAGRSRTTWQVRVEFGVIRPHQTSSNHHDAVGSKPKWQLRVSVEWFECTEPPQTTVRQGEAGLHSSLEWVQGGSTTPNFLEPP